MTVEANSKTAAAPGDLKGDKRKHLEGSCKGKVHDLFDRQGSEAAWTLGLKIKLKQSTLRSWFGQWRREDEAAAAKAGKGGNPVKAVKAGKGGKPVKAVKPEKVAKPDKVTKSAKVPKSAKVAMVTGQTDTVDSAAVPAAA